MDNFVVYAHKRASDGSVFYIGKGRPKRAREKSGRSDYWKRIYEKHGLIIEIIHSYLNESCAFSLERIEIAKHRSMGLAEANFADGGGGASGAGKAMYCSNGMVFSSGLKAVAWLHGNGKTKACYGQLHKCASGKSNSAFGHRWSFAQIPDKPDLVGRSANAAAIRGKTSKAVKTECGMYFPSTVSAKDYLVSIGFIKATSATIVNCCKGRTKSAHGYVWSYANG